MKRIALAALLVLAGCGGCSEQTSNNEQKNNSSATNNNTSSSTNNQDWPEGCADADSDGYPSGLTCEGEVDCDDSDSTVHPGVEEACGDGVDNDCDNTVDEGCPDCDANATRPCGVAEGRCTEGVQSCVDNVWSECVGGEGPAQEVCNGEDDDCDGVTDENPELLCLDGVSCNGEEVCSNGACMPGEGIDCTHLDGPCVSGICSEKDGGCRGFPIENGTACEDGSFCTTGGVCDSGVCESSPRDCAAAGDQCNDGVCDELAGACVPQPKIDGLTCDDGNFCTTADRCTAGVCDGAPRDCSTVANQCNSGMCDEATDSCVPTPVSDGTACEDGAYCTVGDTCVAGACAAGGPRQCGALGGSCREGVCDEAADACTGTPVANGTACEDGQYCTVGDSCLAGACVGGGARDCAAMGNQCNSGVCSEAVNACVPMPVPDGTVCADSDFCTNPDTCFGGVCGGPPRDCSAVADDCNAGVCTPTGCVPQPRADGTACVTGEFCFENMGCAAGVCVGDPIDCSAVTGGDMCLDGVCDETADMCMPVDNGTCDYCLTGSPIADAGNDQLIAPNTNIGVSGLGSSDPTGQALTYSWRLASAPSGSTAQLTSTTGPTTLLLVDVVGDFEICLTVTDTDNCTSSEDCMTATVLPDKSLLVELVWFQDDTDLDLHYRAPGGTFFDTTKGNCNSGGPSNGSDTFWCNTNPDWGGAPGGAPDGTVVNDPALDVDNFVGFGPENVNQDVLFDGSFTVGVHYYGERAPVGPVDARVRVYVNGVQQFEATRTLNCQQFWEAATVNVSAGGTVVNVSGAGGVSSSSALGSYCQP